MTAEEFWSHAARWTYETSATSSMTTRMEHDSAKAILGMGRDAVPLLLAAFTVLPDQWFHFLARITGELPNREWWTPGVVSEIEAAWLRWARENGVRPSPAPPFTPGRIETLLDMLRIMKGDQRPNYYEPDEDFLL